MTIEPDAPATPVAEDATDRDLKRADLRWKIRVAKADLAQKIIVSIVGGVIALVFYAFQENETESRYYSDLQAQRERADSDLRASMFNTLFEAYFKNKLEAVQMAAATDTHTPAGAEALLIDLGWETMLSDLLSRNFETMDVRPLLEDLDNRLTDLIKRSGNNQSAPHTQTQAYLQRERLRRVAYGATARQIELLRANAHAEVQQVRLEQCQDSPTSPAAFAPNELPVLFGNANVRGVINRVEDGSVTITLRVPSGDAPTDLGNSPNDISETVQPRQVPLSVTFFDMPALENVRLSDGRRLALTLTRSTSIQSCRQFSDQMDVTAQQDCKARLDVPRESTAECSWADLSIILIPADYIGMRDRPYLSDLSTRHSGLLDSLSKLSPFGRPSRASE